MSRMPTAWLTCAALVCFAANSLLCRAALGAHLMDPASFTCVRVGVGAAVMLLLARVVRRARPARPGGSWWSALALLVYAAAFSFAYVRIGAGAGALILFAAVQLTMIGTGLVRGSRPDVRQWIGVAVALGGLSALTLPGLGAPDPAGAALMFAAGAAWGLYSLRGRGVGDPLATTAWNFARAVPLAGALLLAGLPWLSVTPRGMVLAASSGALASGIGYAAWYAALRHLEPLHAAVVQLVVPVLAGAGATVLLDEPLPPRLVLSGAVILGGVTLTLWRRRAR